VSPSCHCSSLCTTSHARYGGQNLGRRTEQELEFGGDPGRRRRRRRRGGGGGAF